METRAQQKDPIQLLQGWDHVNLGAQMIWVERC